MDEQLKRIIAIKTGLTVEQIEQMDDDQIHEYIEKKNGRKMTFSKRRILNSGDDSVLLDRGRIRTMEEVDREIDKIVGGAEIE